MAQSIHKKKKQVNIYRLCLVDCSHGFIPKRQRHCPVCGALAKWKEWPKTRPWPMDHPIHVAPENECACGHNLKDELDKPAQKRAKHCLKCSQALNWENT